MNARTHEVLRRWAFAAGFIDSELDGAASRMYATIRSEALAEMGPEDQETLAAAAAAYRHLRPMIEATMADSSRWDGDEDEETILGYYVKWLAAARAQVRAEVLAEAAAELDRMAEHYGPSAQVLRDAAGNVRYMAGEHTRESEPTTPAPDLHGIVMDALSAGQGPLLPLPAHTVRLLATRVTNAVTPLVPYRPVWDGSLPPGGNVCSICGDPVESEPCPQHAPDAGATDHDEWVRCSHSHCPNSERYGKVTERGWVAGGMGTWLCSQHPAGQTGGEAR